MPPSAERKRRLRWDGFGFTGQLFETINNFVEDLESNADTNVPSCLVLDCRLNIEHLISIDSDFGRGVYLINKLSFPSFRK